jgi:hypothetical protein
MGRWVNLQGFEVNVFEFNFILASTISLVVNVEFVATSTSSGDLGKMKMEENMDVGLSHVFINRDR